MLDICDNSISSKIDQSEQVENSLSLFIFVSVYFCTFPRKIPPLSLFFIETVPLLYCLKRFREFFSLVTNWFGFMCNVCRKSLKQSLCWLTYGFSDKVPIFVFVFLNLIFVSTILIPLTLPCFVLPKRCCLIFITYLKFLFKIFSFSYSNSKLRSSFNIKFVSLAIFGQPNRRETLLTMYCF